MLPSHKNFKSTSRWLILALPMVGLLGLTILPAKSESLASLRPPAKETAADKRNEQLISGKVASPINLPIALPHSQSGSLLSYPPVLKPAPTSTGSVEFPKPISPIPGQATIEEQTGSEPTEADDDAEVILDRIRWFKERHPEISPNLKLKTISEEYQKREAEKARITKGATSVSAMATSWSSLGPTNGAGRVSSIAVHPTAMGTAYVGADGGGVWKTTDGGNTWTNLTDSINNLNVGAIALAPSSPNIIYVGTGSEHSSGIGLLKSTDGGNTWQLPSSVITSRFYSISVHPTNPQEIVAGTRLGGLRSTDGGLTWSTVLPVTQSYSAAAVNNLVRDPTNPQILYAATIGYCSQTHSCILKSTDGGKSWATKSVGLPSDGDEMAIAISPSNPLILYVSTSISYDLSHIYKTTDGGESWSELPGVSGSSTFSVSHVLGNQARHDNAIIVSPSDSNTILAMGVYQIRSTDGGTTWSSPPFNRSDNLRCETNVHADITDLKYQGTNLFIVGDGGVFSTPDNGNTAFAHNNGLVIREYYSLSNASPLLRSMFLAGAQDNGTDRRSGAGGTLLTEVNSSDGFDSAINPVTPSIAYATVQYGAIFRTKQSGTVDQCYLEDQHIEPKLPAGELGPFFTRLVMDFNNPSTLYTLSSLRVWRTTNGGDSWTPLPTTTADGSTWASPSKLSVSRSNSNVLMTLSGSNIFRSVDGGASWVKRTPPNFPYSLEIDPKDSNTAYVGSYVFGGNTSSFYMTNDGGVSWIPGGSGLPQGAVLVIRVDPLNSNILYCGTYNGVYTSTDRGANWSKLGTGLPSIYVEDLRVTDDGALLRAATYGRGVWEIQLQPISTVSISGKLADGAGNPIADATLSLSLDGSTAATTQTDGMGNYAFSDLLSGHNYVVTPSKLQYTFAPHAIPFNNFSSNQTANFTGTQTNTTYIISGKVTAPDGNPVAGVLVWMGPAYSYLTNGVFTDGSGNYTFRNVVAGGNYKIQPDNQKFPPPNSNYAFTPNISAFFGLDSNQTADFVASDPFAPNATAATNVMASGFTANWSSVNTATGYRLDVSNNNTFGSFLSGYQDLDVGNALSRSVSGLSNGTTYYYRVRAYNASTTSSNSGTISVKTGSATPTPNPIDSTSFFVTQHYRDFLGREPDAPGLSFWTNEIESCGADAQCREVKRINVSAAFFLSIEFQNTGYLVERMYKVAYGDRTETSTGLVVPNIRRPEFVTDTPLISNNVIVGQGAWEATLESNKVSYAQTFVQRQRFTDIYGALDATQFVDRLNQNAGGVLTGDERARLISEASAGTAAARASVLRKVAENAELDRREKNRAFVLMEYYGYLRRNPDDAPEAGLNFAGWNFWLSKLNQFNGNFINAEMVKAFISSDEYRKRFGQ